MKLLKFLDKLYLKLFHGYSFRTSDGNYPCPNENMTDLDLYKWEEKHYDHEYDRTWQTFQQFVTRKLRN